MNLQAVFRRRIAPNVCNWRWPMRGLDPKLRARDAGLVARISLDAQHYSVQLEN